MNTPEKYQPPGELKNFSTSMTTTINQVKKVTFRIKAAEFIVDWGDGYINYEMTHDYDFEGSYTICITGHGLEELDVKECFLSSLNLDRASSLLNLRCAHNPLKVLDLSELINLKKLNCYGAKLEELDVRNCRDIENLNCGNNHISELYATGCEKLRVFVCTHNKLKSLHIQGCSGLEWMDCSHNLFNAEELETLCDSLPLLFSIRGGHICIGGNEGTRSCEIAKFNIKCWNVDDFKQSRDS